MSDVSMDPKSSDPVGSRRVPATPLQLGMLYHALSSGTSGVDVEQIEFDLDEEVRMADLVAAWQTVMQRHDILRARFAWAGGAEPLLEVPDKVELPVVVHDWSGLDEHAQADALGDLRRSDRRTAFAMDVAPLMRLTLVRRGPCRYAGLWSFHHALLDGRSFPIVLSEVFSAYEGKAADDSSSGRPFEDFARHLQEMPLAPHRHFWSHRLRGLEGATPIKAPYDADPSDPYGDAVEMRLAQADTIRLRDIAARHGVTLNTLVQAAWGLIVHHWSQKNDVVFGVTRACRHAMEGTRDSIGLFINTVPMRIQLAPDLTVTDYLAEVRRQQVELRAFETTPLHLIQDSSPLPKGTPLFDSIVMYDDATLATRMMQRGSPAGAGSRTFRYAGQTNFPLTLLVYGDQQMLVRLEFLRAWFRRETADRLIGQVVRLLLAFDGDGSRSALRLAYLGETEAATLSAWNATTKPYNLDTTLSERFEQQVARTPEAVAVIFDGTSLTYRDFNRRVNQLAHRLIRSGVTANSIVGIYAERSIEMLVAIHAAVKAGGAYVPLDPEHPADRLHFMLQDTAARVVVTQGRLVSRLPSGIRTIVADEASSGLADEPDSNPVVPRSPRDLAYVLYTSGSTGRPKGVMNEHRGIVNRLVWMQEAFELTASDVVLQKTPTSFDVSVWELFWPLLEGAQLVIALPDGHRDTQYLTETIERHAVTTLHFVPSMLQLFLEDPKSSRCLGLQRVICSGEALPRELQDRFFARLPGSALHNLYGPTEAAIDVSWWQCAPSSRLATVPIGRAIANTQLHVLDPLLQSVPIGVAAELHIGGVQVARGYLNRETLTAEKFVADPFSADEDARLYKTGDLARFLPDGNIEYLGRLDFQVKIRGFRIELGEIETVLLQQGQIRECVVLAREDRAGDKRLVAYFVPERGSEPVLDLLRRHLADRVAAYMVPTAFVRLDGLPLSPNGKVDRNALPAPDLPAAATAIAPRHDAEIGVAEVWKEVLGLDSVSITDTFFDLGGNSLLLLRLANGLSAAMGRAVTISELLRFPTVEQQAAMLVKPHEGTDQQLGAASELALQQRQALARRRHRGPGAGR